MQLSFFVLFGSSFLCLRDVLEYEYEHFYVFFVLLKHDDYYSVYLLWSFRYFFYFFYSIFVIFVLTKLWIWWHIWHLCNFFCKLIIYFTTAFCSKLVLLNCCIYNRHCFGYFVRYRMSICTNIATTLMRIHNKIHAIV